VWNKLKTYAIITGNGIGQQDTMRNKDYKDVEDGFFAN
jgi:hypothetical protein